MCTVLEDVAVVSGGLWLCWRLGPRCCQRSEGFEVQACWGSEGAVSCIETLGE